MEPFSVTCETCKARLKVRSASAIGQIHSCPRCESMVHILPPPGWMAGPSKNSAAVAAALAAPAASSATFKQVTVPSQAAADSFAEAVATALEGTAGERGAMDHQFAEAWADVPGVGGPPIAVSSPGLVAKFKAAFAALPASSGVLIGVGSATAIALVGALTFALWPSADADDQPQAPVAVAQAAVPAVDGQEISSSTDDVEKSKSSESVATIPAKSELHEVMKPTEEAVAVHTSSVPPVAPISTVNSSAKANPTPEAVASIATTHTSVSEPATPVNVPPRVAVAATPAAARSGVLTIDPLDPLNFDPANLSLPTASAPPASAATSALPSNDMPAARPAAKDAAAVDALRQAREELPTISVRRGPPAAGVTPVRNTASQLGMPIRSLNARSMRLGAFIEMMSQMSAVPVTLSPAALEMTGASPRREVTVDAKDTTVEKLMRDVLGKQRLDFVERGGQLIVVGKDADVRRTRDYDVADLLNVGETNATRLAELVERFVAPESWSPEGGRGTIAVQGTTLQVEQADQVHIGVLVFCERLRAARGLPLKSRYPADRLAVESPYTKLSAKLNAPTTFTFVPWTQFVDVVRNWQEQSGTTILVDWQALSEIDLAMATPISCSVIRRPWRESLDEILAPLGLAWWAVDGETIQITSLAAAERLQRIEIFSVPEKLREQFADNAALVATLQSEIREQVPSAAAGCAIEADGRHLIVRGNASVHKYLTARLAGEP